MINIKRIFILFGIGSLCFLLLFPLIILIVTLTTIGAALGQSNTSFGGYSEGVLSYQASIEKYCKQFDISDYAALVMAVMQQESGGAGNDPMQCSESPYNLDYPQQPGGITDPDYSIKIGTQYLASCIRAAKVKSPDDISGISLALQGYNFGGGYISWAAAQGGYSKQNAVAFSELKATQLGWTGYGDSDYVSHVLRYYSLLYPSGNGTFHYPLATGTYSITSGYGYRWGELHKGIDFAAPEGTKIYASASGTVVFSGFGSADNGFNRYGNVILIKHDETYSTLYAHCSQLLVPAGSTVKQGTVIALVGSTGESTGNHCHFEVRKNGSAVDPKGYLK
ncbi:peptidoglycan DD-metalloendopeptidase family protein [Faecalispora anaeroviscerum]|uniref:peptidoglycan DD-metalloendopeptidase family protein n=1 Tax=Faecalispora anaeroviscerum TaxID=2991836 RepID=UPI0024BAC570|nr:lysozyme family protein [Faecalispora anaeroviscerum]